MISAKVLTSTYCYHLFLLEEEKPEPDVVKNTTVVTTQYTKPPLEYLLNVFDFEAIAQNVNY